MSEHWPPNPPLLPPGIWDNPRPEDKEAYLIFVEVWSANNAAYEEYEEQKIEQERIDLANSILTAQSYAGSYSCVTEGSDSSTGTDATFSVTTSAGDGYVSAHGAYPSETQVQMGCYTVQVLDKGINLPESEFTFPDEEITVSAQDIGSHPLWAWFDFTSVSIPQGAKINKAFLRLDAANGSQQNNEVLICAEDIDTASATPTVSTMPQKTRTDNRVAWTIPSTWYYNGSHDTSDIACVVQEVVNRAGWSSGNTLRVFVDYSDACNWSTAYSYDNTASKPVPKLIVWYGSVFNESGSGGLEAAGSATISQIHNETGSGGAELNGDSDDSFRPDIDGSGGVEVAGLATDTIKNNIAASGGTEAAGSATSKATYSITVSGGVEAAGEAVVTSEGTYNETMSGGIELAGLATLSVTITRTPSGGVELAGTSDESFNDIFEPSGGAELAGIADVTSAGTYNETMSGGAELAGTATPSTTYSITTSGNSEAAGVADVTSAGTYNETMSGGVEVAGTHVQTFIDYFTASGGAELAGEAVVTSEGTYDEEMSGGIELAGAAKETFYDIVATSGGVELAGLAKETLYDVVEISGGAELAGAAKETQAYSLSTSGGAELAGSSDESFSDLVEVSGGVELAGTITIASVWQPTASGGAELAGSADESKVAAESASGGLELAGSANEFFVYNPEILGRKNLVRNGDGSLGDNTYFPSLTYDDTDYPWGTQGSFLHDGGYTNVSGTDYIKVNVNNTYYVSAVGKGADGTSGNYDPANRQYVGIRPFDADYNYIDPYYVQRYPGSALTTLAAPLNNGDSTMQLTDASGWYNGATASYRCFCWWPYTNAQGYTYPDWTYSRNFSGVPKWAEGGITGNVVTLTSTWAGGNLPAGTPVKNTYPAWGSYTYCIAIYQTLTEDWTTYSYGPGTLTKQVSDTNGVNGWNEFRYGTEYVLINFLINYSPTTPMATRWADIKLEFYPRTLAGGTTTLSQVTEATASGGTELAGSATVSNISQPSVSGGAELAGSASPNNIWQPSVSGGIELAGSADETFSDVVLVSGGAELAGLATVETAGTYNETMSGGLEAAGLAGQTLNSGGGAAPTSGIIPILMPAAQPGRKPACVVNTLSLQYTGLKAWWAAEPNDQIAYERTNRGLDGTFQNGASITLDDERGWVFGFDDTQEEIDGTGTIDRSIPFTHSAWFRTDSADWDGTSDRMVFIYRGESPIPYSYVWIEFKAGNLQYGCRTGNYIALSTDTTNSWDDGEWHLAVGVTHAVNDHELYVDGELVASSSTTCNQSPITTLFRFGDDGSYPAEFPGKIDDIRVYDYALGEDQIKHLYNPQTRYDLWKEPERVITAGAPVAITGGAEVAGTATEFVITAFAPTGGVEAAGTATETIVAIPTPTGGVEVAGTITETLNSANVASGGAEVAGEAVVSTNGIYNETGSGGVELAGTSDESFSDLVEVSGGAEAAGTAEVDATYALVVSGGAEAAGTAEVDATYALVVSGGAELAGSAAISRLTELTIGGGVEVAGSADESFVYNPEINSKNNFMTNGRGELGDNTNFSSYTFDDQNYPFDTYGSFKYTGAYVSHLTDSYIKINPDAYYDMSVVCKAGDGDGTNFDPANKHLVGVACFDPDHQFVSSWLIMKYGTATDTTLDAPLNNGDSTVQLGNATGWQDSTSSPYYQRQFTWWPYTDGQGNEYDPYTYTRNISLTYYGVNPAWDGISGNVLQLTSSWTGPNLPAGTPIRNTNAGSTYNYCIGYVYGTESWQTATGHIEKNPNPTSGGNAETYFRPGTQYVKACFLDNFPSTDATNVIRWADVRFEIYTQPNAAGAAELSKVAEETASGGAELGGSATVNSTKLPSISGGVEVAGTHVQTFIDYFIASGGVELAGLAEVTSEGTYDEEMSGGIEVAGTADEDFTDQFIASGGVETNGSATNTLASRNIASGGAEAAGIAEVDAVYALTVSGGAEAAGIAEVDAVYTLTVSGGAEATGAADENFNDQFVASGGVETSGVAEHTLISQNVATGGAELAGTADESFSDVILTSGGAELGGSATVITSIRYWVGSGSTDWSNNYNWSDTSGGSGGAGQPTSISRTYFDGGGTGNVLINTTANMKSLTISSGYTGNFDAGSQNVNVGDITINKSSGIFDFGTNNTWTISGNFNSSPFTGTWTYGSATLVFTGTGKTWTCGNTSRFFSKVTISGSIALGSTITVYASFIIQAGASLELTSTNIIYLFQGNYTISGDLFGTNGSLSASLAAGDSLSLDGTGSIDLKDIYVTLQSTTAILSPGTYKASGTINLTNGSSTTYYAQFQDGTYVFDCTTFRIGVSNLGTQYYTASSGSHFNITGSVVAQHSAGPFYWIPGDGTITLSGDKNQNFDWDNQIIENLIIDKSAGTVTFIENCPAQSLTITDPGDGVDFGSYTHDFFDGWSGYDDPSVDYLDATIYSLGHQVYPPVGSEITGTAEVLRTYIETPSGGIELAGSADEAGTYNLDTSGGVEIAGIAGEDFNDTFVPSGGVELAGLAEVTIEGTYNETMSGGMEAAGVARNTLWIAEGAPAGIEIGLILPPVPAQKNRKPTCRPNTTSLQHKGLVAWWPASSVGGTEFYDAIGDNAGTISGSPDLEATWAIDAERNGHVLQLDGTDDYVDLGSNFPDGIEAGGSICAWVKRDNYVGGAIFSISSSTSWPGERLVLYCRSDTNTFGWSIADGVNYQTTADPIANVLPVGEWKHITLTWDGSNCKFYIDGIYYNALSTAQVYTPDITGQPAWIGRSRGLANQYFGGSLDDIRVYNRALSSAEVQQLYNPQTRYELWFVEELATPIVSSAAKGVEVGGAAKITTSDIVEVGGGVEAAGTATTYVVYNPQASGGAEVAGHAIDELEGTIYMDGGVELAGTADEDFNDVFLPSGGVELAGSATETQAYAETGSGGAEVAGSATETQNYAETGSGGAEVAGSALLGEINWETASGGVEVAGTATWTNTWQPTASGGAEIAGTADEDFNDIFVPSGGVEIAGVAIETVEGSYDETMKGGVEVAGFAKQTFYDQFIASGGAEVAGSATEAATYNPQVSGGVKVAGSAAEIGIYDLQASGGAEVAGLATEAATYNLQTSGGTEIAGEVTEAGTYEASASGGTEVAGSIVEVATYNPQASGGAEVAGHAIDELEGTIYMDGGVKLAGTADEDFNDVFLPSGGVEVAGTVGSTSSYEPEVSGGTEAAGSANINVVYAISTSGGAEVAGQSATSFNFNHAYIKYAAFPIPMRKSQPNRKPASQVNRQSVQAKGLAAWWRFEGAGVSVPDLIGGNSGTVQSGGVDVDSMWHTDPDRGGWVLDLRDSSDYVLIGDGANLDVAGGDFSVSAWVKWTESTGNARAIINIGAFSDNILLSTGYLDAGQDKVGFGYRRGAPNVDWFYNAGSGLNDGNWHLVTATLQGSTVTIYVDGVSESYTSGGNANTLTSNRIGDGSHGDFSGDVDDIRIYNRALTATEVGQLYNPQTRYELWQEADIAAFGPVEYEQADGVEASGTADVSVIYNVQASGGAEVAGSARETFNDTFVPSGGAELAGEAEVITEGTYNETMLGGVEVAGTADEDFNDIFVPSGGVELAGSAKQTLYDIVEVSGGAEIAGSATDTLSSANVASGGVEAAGSATETLNSQNVATGGAEVAGQAAFGETNWETASGGAEVAGVAKFTNTWQPTASGGAELAGTADEDFNDIFVPSGGVELAGVAEESVEGSYDETMQGGVEVAGSAKQTFYDQFVASGGAEVAGTATTEATYPLQVSGGAETNGTADVDAIYNSTASGGAEVAGESDESFSDVIEISGGVEVAGAAEETLDSANVASGGAEVAGTADVDVAYNLSVSGGVEVAGAANETLDSSNLASGGVEVAGAAIRTAIYYHVPTAQETIFPIPSPRAQPNRQPSTQINTRSPQFNGLVSWWTGSLADGERLYDPAGGNTGTISGGLPEDIWTIDAERNGHVLELDGTNDFVVCTNNDRLHQTGAQTITLWYKSLSTPTVSDEGVAGTFITGGFQITHHTDDRLWCYVGSGGNNIQSAVWADNDWHHVVFTWDGSTGTNGMKVYVDGVLSGQGTSAIGSIGSSQPFLIGAYNGKYRHAQFDDVRYYKRYLTAQEVQALYNPQTRYELWKEPEIVTVIHAIDGIGVKANGTADVNIIYNPQASGGAEVSGSHDQTFTDFVDMTGGAEVAGEAEVITEGTYNETMSGGVEVAGAADENFNNIFRPSGGVEVAGTADETFSDVFIPTGGVEVAGAAKETFSDYVEGSGGIEASGSGDEWAIYNPDLRTYKECGMAGAGANA